MKNKKVMTKRNLLFSPPSYYFNHLGASARKRARPYGCREPEFGRLLFISFDIAKKSGNLFRFDVNGCRLFTNIPGLFLIDFDRVFSVVRPVKRRFLQKKRMVRSSILFFYVIFFIYGRFYELLRKGKVTNDV